MHLQDIWYLKVEPHRKICYANGHPTLKREAQNLFRGVERLEERLDHVSGELELPICWVLRGGLFSRLSELRARPLRGRSR